MEPNHLYEVVVTAIIVKDGKYLITRRSKTRKRFPGEWAVPGGHLEIDDYIDLPKDKKGYWRNVLEQALKREVQEEVGLEIDKLEYVTTLATVHQDGNSSMVISFSAEHKSGEVKLQKKETDDFRWVSLEEAKGYSLLDGIYDELVIVEKKREGLEKKKDIKGEFILSFEGVVFD